MKVLFAVSNEEISESIVKKYQKEYKQIISYKNVYYFNAIMKELQKEKSYDRIVISEDLESFTHTQYDQIDKFIFDKLDSISDEASNIKGNDIPIILICSDRREKSEEILVKLFGIGIYNAIIGNDRSVDEVCRLINRPRVKKEAKAYYKIDSEDVNYQAENENDVSEMEIQNIIAHYKRLGKDEARYVDSFNNIAAQYNDTQLRIISKFLPLNVRAVLEEKSQKYQQIMSFNNSVSDKLRYQNNKEEKQGTSEKLLVPKSPEQIMSKPVVIPTAVNMESNKKLAKTQRIEEKEPEIIEEQDEEVIENEVGEPIKRGRGRPRKYQISEQVEEGVKKRRGRPRKNPVPELEIEEDDEDINILPGIDLPEIENVQEAEEIFDEKQEQPEFVLPSLEEKEENDILLPGIEEPEEFVRPVLEQPSGDFVKEYEPVIDISSLLVPGKKIVSFVGTSKNGVSFIINNIAELLSSMGINVAILDTTKNRNSYYIYTKNEEQLRNIATNSINGLANGIANGISINKNLTVYTSLPNEEDNIEEADKILQTLIKNHSLVLIDTDFETPIGYFEYSQEIYLVQTLDILTIQPLTAFLRELKAKNVLDENKLRIILNKTVKIRGITEKTIIGGMAYYNDPAMSFMTELFNRNTIKYVTIPYEEEIYTKYLEGIINCNITLKGYSKSFMQTLKELGNMIYQPYKPAALNYSQPFSQNMKQTLEQMKRNY